MCSSCTASAPVFVPNPIRVIATLGKDVSLECKPRASPKPRITWRRGDRKIQPSRRYSLPVIHPDLKWTCLHTRLLIVSERRKKITPSPAAWGNLKPYCTAQGHCGSADVWSCKGYRGPYIKVITSSAHHNNMGWIHGIIVSDVHSLSRPHFTRDKIVRTR